MRKDKEQAFELRRQGKSYRELENLLGVSRSTLSIWFKNIAWSKHIEARNIQKNTTLSRVRILAMNTARQNKLDTLYKEVRRTAIQEYQTFKNEPLFTAGLMLYAGEGDKVSKNLTRISNSEFYIHKIFIRFTLKYLGVSRRDLRCGLILYGEHDIETCLEKWSEELGLTREQFHKPQIIAGREKTKRLQFGVGMSILSSTSLKKRVLTWLEVCSSDAGLV